MAARVTLATLEPRAAPIPNLYLAEAVDNSNHLESPATEACGLSETRERSTTGFSFPVVALVMQARSFPEDPLHSKPALACPLPTMESLECSSTETGTKPGLCKNCHGIEMDSYSDFFTCLFAGEERELPLPLPLHCQ